MFRLLTFKTLWVFDFSEEEIESLFENYDGMTSDLHIGIDYSGRETPTSRTPALQVYVAFDTEEPRRILSPASSEKTYKNWCRKEIAEWLIEQANKNITFIAEAAKEGTVDEEIEDDDKDASQ